MEPDAVTVGWGLGLGMGLGCSYCKKMVDVMRDLQRHRQSSAVFAGKHGFITPRDLFRWADRHANVRRKRTDPNRDTKKKTPVSQETFCTWV